MLVHNALLTQSPHEVHIPTFDWLHGEITPESSEKLTSFQDALRQLQDETVVTDQYIVETVNRQAQVYINRFGRNTLEAISYIGDAEVMPAIADPSRNDHAESSPQYNSQAFKKFAEAFDSECWALGIKPSERQPYQEVMLDSYGQFSTNLVQNFKAQQKHFAFLAGANWTPDVLRAEAVEAGIFSLKQMAAKLERYGSRPAEQNLFAKLGTILTGNENMSQSQYDGLVDEKLTRYQVPGVDALLSSYVQTAEVYYAKLVYGTVPFVLDRGFESDPDELYDTFQAKSNPGGVTRPRLPTEIATSSARSFINDMLYGAESELSNMFDSSGTDTQRDRRRGRQDFNARYEHTHTPRFSSFTDSAPSENAHWRPQAESVPVESALDQRAGKLNTDLRDMYMQFSRLLSDTRIDSDSEIYIERFQEDFVSRLEKLQEKPPAQPKTMDKILKSGARDFHPDINHDPDAQILCGLYGQLRDLLSD